MSRERQHRSVQEWASLVAEYRGGDEDEATFCERRGLSRHTFRKHRYGKRAKRDRETSRKGGFAEVTITPRAVGHVTVYGVDGMRIEIPLAAGMLAVAELVKALGGGR